MRIVFAAALLAPALVPAIAAAHPITVGAAYGLTQSKVDANADPNTMLSVFGRLGFNQHASVRVDLQKIETDNDSTSIRTGTVLLELDLGSGQHLVPMILAGAGLDSASTTWGESTDAHHFEGGLGLEYRADGGLVVGADARVGGRSIDSQSAVATPGTVGVALRAPASTLEDGEYRSLRAYVGVRF